MPKADFVNASRQIKALPPDMETKAAEWEIKALDDTGKFSAYFAAFGNVDRGGDVIDSGAFRNLAEYVKSGWIGVNHNMNDLPVAYPIRAVQDSKGLLIDGQFHSTPEAQACRTVVTERMKAGKAVKGSIGYKTDDAVQEQLGGKFVRRIKGLSLYEASFVNLPMNPEADAISAKSLTPVEGLNVEAQTITIEALKTWLDTECKAGRVLSKGNHAKLKSWHGTLSTMCNDMKSLVDQYDPDRDDDDDSDGHAEPERDKAVIDPARAAGNSLNPGQGTGGAVTAEDLRRSKAADEAELRERREKALQTLRARAVQAQRQFAMLPASTRSQA